MKTALELSMNYDSIPLSKRLAGINEGRPQLQTKTLNADDPPADWKPDVEIDWSNINKIDRETGTTTTSTTTTTTNTIIIIIINTNHHCHHTTITTIITIRMDSINECITKW